jgi:hypothetical protein
MDRTMNRWLALAIFCLPGGALALLGWAAFRALRIPTHNG